MYKCDKCYHQFSGTPSSLAACNCCEDGNFFESIQPEESEEEEMMLSDRRTPTCPHCGMAKLEKDDIIDHWVEGGENNTDVYVELVVGGCPNCGSFFEYKQKYTHDPINYEMLTDCTEDEEDEEDE